MKSKEDSEQSPPSSPSSLGSPDSPQDGSEAQRDIPPDHPADPSVTAKATGIHGGFLDRILFYLGVIKHTGIRYDINHKLQQKIKPLHEYANGYSKIAAFEACDDNFLIYKKFGWLHNRVLLYIQDELLEFQHEILELDKLDEQEDPRRLASRRRDDALGPQRRDLIKKVEQNLARYDELLLRMHKLSNLETPTSRNQNSLFNTIHNTHSQTASELDWIRDREDLVALAPDQERSLPNAIVEDSFKAFSRSLTMSLFRTEDQRTRTGKEIYLNLLSQDRLNLVVNVVITIIATLLLLIPIAILDQGQLHSIAQLAVIFGFVLLFALCCAIFTRARKQEVFGATAAYAAVLVVFLANNNNGTTIAATSR